MTSTLFCAFSMDFFILSVNACPSGINLRLGSESSLVLSLIIFWKFEARVSSFRCKSAVFRRLRSKRTLQADWMGIEPNFVGVPIYFSTRSSFCSSVRTWYTSCRGNFSTCVNDLAVNIPDSASVRKTLACLDVSPELIRV